MRSLFTTGAEIKLHDRSSTEQGSAMRTFEVVFYYGISNFFTSPVRYLNSEGFLVKKHRILKTEGIRYIICSIWLNLKESNTAQLWLKQCSVFWCFPFMSSLRVHMPRLVAQAMASSATALICTILSARILAAML